MCLRMGAFGSMLLIVQSVSAGEAPELSRPSVFPPTDAPSVQKAPGVSTLEQQQHLLREKCVEMDRLRREIDRLRAATGTPQQILVKVRMLEVSLTKLRSIGAETDWFADGYSSGPKLRKLLDELGGQAATPSAEPSEQEQASDGLRLVDWLQRNNLAKVVSDPTLVAMSGRPARVHVGGEFPVPSSDNSEAAAEFKTFGMELELLAESLGDNQVRVEVGTRVSELDDARAVEMNGARIPGLRVRQCDTGFEIAFGQTAVLTGLVEKRREAQQLDGGRIEVVTNDIGLMVVVTPELVPTIEVSAGNVKRPLDGAVRQ